MTASLGGARSGEALRALELEGEGLVARYSRELEHAADREGQVLAARAGYDPLGMATFLAALDRETTFRLGRPRRPTFLDTHPAAPERAQNAAATARRLTPPPPSTRPASAFLDRLDGLLVGDDPAEGAVREGAFLHPDLDLRLQLPPRLARREHARRGGRGAGRRAARARARDAGGLPRPGGRGGALPARRQAHARAHRQRPARGRGRAGAPGRRARPARRRAALRAAVLVRARRARSTASSASERARASSASAAGRAIARSFRPLTPAERASFRVRHLRVIPARAGERFEDLLARGGNVERLDQISLATRSTSATASRPAGA